MSDVTTNEYTEDGKLIRKVRSFVRREGRLTKGQQKALDECWPTMGIDYQEQLLDWNEVFGNDNPVVLEIGFGMGASLVEMAKAAPNKNFIGIEVHSPGVGACLASAQEAGVTNLRVMCHDAVEVFANMIEEGSLSTVQLFFPDPWHKKRHHKRRIVQLDFAEMVRSKLIMDSGIFHMATDWENYAEHMIEIMEQAPGYANIAEEGPYIPRPEERPLTKFEARGHRLGHGVWDIKYKRTA
jgi:tRNA (guanine-N7-)-methyltransferase